jgi:hypothetical protein
MKRKIPLSVAGVACLYLAVGVAGFVFHFRDLRASDGVSIELTELLAIVCGVFLLRAQNWARWLAVAWIGFHVVLSVGVMRELIAHALICAAIVWLLFLPDASRYFQGARTEAS